MIPSRTKGGILCGEEILKDTSEAVCTRKESKKSISREKTPRSEVIDRLRVTQSRKILALSVKATPGSLARGLPQRV